MTWICPWCAYHNIFWKNRCEACATPAEVRPMTDRENGCGVRAVR